MKNEYTWEENIPDPDFEDCKDAENVIAISKNNESKKESSKNKGYSKFRSSQHFVETFLNQGAYYVSKDRLRFCNKKGVRVKNYRTEILKFWDLEKNRKNVNKKDIMEFLQEKIADLKKEIWDEVKNKVTKFVDDKGEELQKIADIAIKEDKRIFKTSNDHFIAQQIFKITYIVWAQNLKSKLLGITHRWPLIPVFWSYKGGTGKSALLEYLISPFAPFTYGADLDKMTETDKNFKIFSEKMVVFCEELAGASRANIEALKNMGTRKTVQARIFHSQDHEDEDCFSGFVYTCNFPISKMINDPSNRRHVDIEIPCEITEDELKTIDFLKLIQSIKIDVTDEEKANTRLLVERFVSPFQESTKRKDFIEEFIEEANIIVSDDKKLNGPINILHIFDSFKSYYNYLDIKVTMRKDVFVNEFCQRLRIKVERTKAIKNCVFINLTEYKPDATIDIRRLAYSTF